MALATHMQRSRAVSCSAVATRGDAAMRINRSGLNGLTSCGTKGLQLGSFEVTASQPVRYTVEETPGILELHNKALLRGVASGPRPSDYLPTAARSPSDPLRRLVIIDENVERIYGAQLRRFLEHHGVDASIVPLPTWEEHKTLDLVQKVLEAIEAFKVCRRREPIIAIGGGVCLDVAGLAAHLYRRTTPIIKVPTTLMGLVDASVGIKTGVNWGGKKNCIGTYSAPAAVLADVSWLKSLDMRNICNGSAEILKMACIKDEVLFNILETHATELLNSKFQCAAARPAVRRSIQGMLEELEPNLWEAHLVRCVDYGHTFSPAVEMAALNQSNHPLLHGEAVAIDMALSTELAAGRGLITPVEVERVYRVLSQLRLPLIHEVVTPELLMKGLGDTTLARDGLQRAPLMSGIGAVTFVDDLTRSEVCAALERLLMRAAERDSEGWQLEDVAGPLLQPQWPSLEEVLAPAAATVSF